MNTQPQNNSVFYFVGNLDLNTETLKAFLIAEQIGELLRVDCFADEKRKLFTYTVYLTTLFQNSFTNHLLNYLNNEGHKYEMTFEWNGIPGNYFYISLFNSQKYAKYTSRRFYSEYELIDESIKKNESNESTKKFNESTIDSSLKANADFKTTNTSLVQTNIVLPKFSLIHPVAVEEKPTTQSNKQTTFLNINIQNYEKIKKVLEESTSGKGKTRFIQITITPEPFEVECTQYAYDVIMANIDKDEEEEWSWDV